MIEEHLRSCHHCAREVDLIREIVSEPEPEDKGLIDRLGIRKIVPLRPRRAPYNRFWLGDKGYSLAPMNEYRDLMEVEGLYLPELLELRREDRNDPGSVPVALEAQGRQPIVASLSSFEAAGDFREPSEDMESTGAKVADEELRFFAPVLGTVCPSSGLLGMARNLRVLSGKGRRKKRPKPKLVLKCRAKDNDLELYHNEESDEIFLNIQARKDGKG